MPGYNAHLIYGISLYKRFDTTSREIIKNNSAPYKAGLQGADIFFYNIPSMLKGHNNIGTLIHKSDVFEFCQTMKSYALKQANPDAKHICLAYYEGFLAHCFLDNALHPYINDLATDIDSMRSYEQHITIETEFDYYLIKTLYNISPTEFTKQHFFSLTKEQRNYITAMLAYVISVHFSEATISKVEIDLALISITRLTRLFSANNPRIKNTLLSFEHLFSKSAHVAPVILTNDTKIKEVPLLYELYKKAILDFK